MTHHDLGFDITHALEEVTVPVAVLDRNGRIRWQNRESMKVVGDQLGQSFARLVAPEDIHLARTNFAKKLRGEATSTDYDVTVLRRDGRRLPVHVSSVPLRERGEVVGVFAVAYPAESGGETYAPSAPAGSAPDLTARQYETLTLLAEGLGTDAIAVRLGVAEETARNHIRGLLRQLGAHSRLEAVVRAYRLGLLRPGDDR